MSNNRSVERELFDALNALSRSAKDALSDDPHSDWRDSLADGIDLARHVLADERLKTVKADWVRAWKYEAMLEEVILKNKEKGD